VATAHIAYAYSERQGDNSLGKYHAVLNEDFASGRYRREKGQTACPKKDGFWWLEERREMTEPGCPRCAEAVRRHGITIQPSYEPEDSGFGFNAYERRI
jgi:hypothetical protein